MCVCVYLLGFFEKDLKVFLFCFVFAFQFGLYQKLVGPSGPATSLRGNVFVSGPGLWRRGGNPFWSHHLLFWRRKGWRMGFCLWKLFFHGSWEEAHLSGQNWGLRVKGAL